MKAHNMPFDHEKCQEISRELFREHGWKMPEGLADRTKSDPRNFTLEEWQQAKRIDKDPRDITDAISDAWMISDTKATFAHALKERGYWLARGDSKSYVAVDYHGEVYSIGRKTGVKVRQVKERLGDKEKLPSVDDAKADMAHDIQFMLARLQAEQLRTNAFQRERYQRIKERLVAKQRIERQGFDNKLRQRQEIEQRQRQAQFRSGLKGLWDRIRGEHKRMSEQHRLKLAASQKRDNSERDTLIFRQQDSRNALRLKAKVERSQYAKAAHELQKDAERYHDIGGKDQERPFPNAPNAKAGFGKAAEQVPSNAADDNVERRQFMKARRNEAASTRSPSRDGPSLER